jgi:hypothetical protein
MSNGNNLYLYFPREGKRLDSTNTILIIGGNKMQEKIYNQMKEMLNEGFSIFGELDESVRRLEDLKEEIKQTGAADVIYSLDAFEVIGKTKNHETPYVTMSINGELISGYATALGNKLTKLAKKFGETENNHFFMRELGLPVQLLVQESQNGEYLDLKVV